MGRWNRDPSPFEVKSLVHKARVFGNPKSFWTSKVLIMPFFQLSPWRQPSYVMSTWHKPLWSRADIYRSLQYMIPRFFKRFGQEKHLQENPPENPPVFPKWSSRLEFTSLTTKTSHVFWFDPVKLYPLVNWHSRHSYWKWPFLVDLPIYPLKRVVFHAYVNVYQRLIYAKLMVNSSFFWQKARRLERRIAQLRRELAA